ncbi:hypothetical protein ESZ53_02290 [Salinibacterium sp. UTAS2018]|uniref:hypothetical protein n=1 Tax=Salinibacterium sp. UTAS2018 TaxID=2508880 RepID=UPI0010094A1C|nr:hypothetical protein [Salinibacterium sp. UTAS2018]QAV69371.1 hypothetical protein ESZ53_02290 [Salinibacterium sp. UTAS2018]
MSENLMLIEFDVDGERVLAQSSNENEFIDTSAFTPTTGRIAIYSDCIGFGRITIALDDDIETSRVCRTNAEDAAHKDDLVVDASTSYSVSVSLTENQPWAVTVTELPPE